MCGTGARTSRFQAGGTGMTVASPISSASCQRAARSSAPGGPRTTCAVTAPGASSFHGLSLVYSAEPGSASQDGLDLLACWAATLDQLDPAATAPAPDQA